MNELRSFARIAIASIGLFFAFRLLNYMITFGNVLIYMGFGDRTPSARIILATVSSLILLGLCLGATCYLCLCKREQLAERLVGKDELADPHSQVDWLYVAFRLVCITGGIYCLHSVAWHIAHALRAYLYGSASRAFSAELILGWLVTLAIGIYLVCGAPHFVRWHVTKTLEQCRLQEQEPKLE